MRDGGKEGGRECVRREQEMGREEDMRLSPVKDSRKTLGNEMVYPGVYCFKSKTMTMIRWGKLPRAVVKVGVPRGPGAVEGKGELLVVLVLLTPHPKGGEHLDLPAGAGPSGRPAARHKGTGMPEEKATQAACLRSTPARGM